MALLGVNIDHVATLRQARYRPGAGGTSDYGEPDPARAAHEAELGGADCITVHLREDRRHVIDRDLDIIAATTRVKLNLEMACSPEMVALAVKLRPHMATLVPEGRQEVTTEGGLDVAAAPDRIRESAARLKGAGIIVSAFIDPELPQVVAAKKAGFDYCEVHTGEYARAFHRAGGDVSRIELLDQIERLALAGGEIAGSGMRFNAGHGLNYVNVSRVAALPGICELHIGHAIVSRAVYVGLRQAVAEMKALAAVRSPGA